MKPWQIAKLPSVNLIPASPEPLPGLAEMLLELGTGESGFNGTPFASGAMTLEQYLEQCVNTARGKNLPRGYVPQTTFWLSVEGELVGTVRMRHALTPTLHKEGGHIGYYIRPSARRRGYAAAALNLTLKELAKVGVTKALVTVHADNVASNKTAQSCGGRLEHQRPYDGRLINYYWFETG